jgi:hypothetical protein
VLSEEFSDLWLDLAQESQGHVDRNSRSPDKESKGNLFWPRSLHDNHEHNLNVVNLISLFSNRHSDASYIWFPHQRRLVPMNEDPYSQQELMKGQFGDKNRE